MTEKQTEKKLSAQDMSEDIKTQLKNLKDLHLEECYKAIQEGTMKRLERDFTSDLLCANAKPDSLSVKTLVEAAIDSDNKYIVEFLMDRMKMDVSDRQNAVLYCVKAKKNNILKCILSAPNVKDVFKFEKKAASTLQKGKTDEQTAEAPDNFSALHWCLWQDGWANDKERHECVKSLLEASASVTIKGSKGTLVNKTPGDIAKEKGLKGIRLLLESYQGFSNLLEALSLSKMSHQDKVQGLKESGIDLSKLSCGIQHIRQFGKGLGLVAGKGHSDQLQRL